ncbi:MAG: replication initiator protein [Microviridae sp.]|nr:MAG: replication initiator protein [Microviridae sp.]
MHEAQFHEFNCFITLTYNDESLPAGGTLVKKHFQDFMKRLRYHVKEKYGISRVSYFHCGEYGERLRRPHYHAILFGMDFSDKKEWKRSETGTLYRSEELDSLWQLGFCSVGAVTLQSCAYVARYVMKKITGAKASEHYISVDSDTGEISDLQPEYITMSLKPAIGERWFAKYQGDVYPDDFAVMDGKKLRVPRYYDKKLELVDEDLYKDMKRERVARASTRKARLENGPIRLAVREECKEAALSTLKREFEDD